MGEADNYYTPNAGQWQQQQNANWQQQQQYGQQQQWQQQPQQQQAYNQPPPPPPQNQQPYVAPNGNGYDTGYYDEKHSFNQTFKIDKPKYNDVWAAILVIPSLSYSPPIETSCI